MESFCDYGDKRLGFVVFLDQLITLNCSKKAVYVELLY